MQCSRFRAPNQATMDALKYGIDLRPQLYRNTICYSMRVRPRWILRSPDCKTRESIPTTASPRYAANASNETFFDMGSPSSDVPLHSPEALELRAHSYPSLVNGPSRVQGQRRWPTRLEQLHRSDFERVALDLPVDVHAEVARNPPPRAAAGRPRRSLSRGAILDLHS